MAALGVEDLERRLRAGPLDLEEARVALRDLALVRGEARQRVRARHGRCGAGRRILQAVGALGVEDDGAVLPRRVHSRQEVVVLRAVVVEGAGATRGLGREGRGGGEEREE